MTDFRVAPNYRHIFKLKHENNYFWCEPADFSRRMGIAADCGEP